MTTTTFTGDMTYLGMCHDFLLRDLSGLYPNVPDIRAWVTDDGLFHTSADIPVVAEEGLNTFPGRAHVTSGGLHDRLADSLDALAEAASDFLDAAFVVGWAEL